MILFKNGKTSEANSLRKHINKKKFVNLLLRITNVKVKDLFSIKPKKCYSRIKKKKMRS